MRRNIRGKKSYGIVTVLLLLCGLNACTNDSAGKSKQVKMQEDRNEEPGEKANSPESPEAYDELRKQEYISVLENIYLNHIFLDGTDYGFDDYYNISENQFAVYDIDQDGEKELLVHYITTNMAGMVEIIYDYDHDSGKVREEFLEFPALKCYDNGVIEAGWSHNQGLAGRFWPYTLYKYDKESDTYFQVAMVDAWDKTLSEKDYDGNSFPDSVDVNGDGIVYYIMSDGKYEFRRPVDGEEYNQWRNSYLGNAELINIPYQSLTEENIYAIN